MSIETMGRSRRQRTKPGLDYRDGRCVGAPAAIVGEVPKLLHAQIDRFPARYAHTGSRWVRRPDSSRPREGITVRDLRPASCDPRH